MDPRTARFIKAPIAPNMKRRQVKKTKNWPLILESMPWVSFHRSMDIGDKHGVVDILPRIENVMVRQLPEPVPTSARMTMRTTLKGNQQSVVEPAWWQSCLKVLQWGVRFGNALSFLSLCVRFLHQVRTRKMERIYSQSLVEESKDDT